MKSASSPSIVSSEGEPWGFVEPLEALAGKSLLRPENSYPGHIRLPRQFTEQDHVTLSHPLRLTARRY